MICYKRVNRPFLTIPTTLILIRREIRQDKNTKMISVVVNKTLIILVFIDEFDKLKANYISVTNFK